MTQVGWTEGRTDRQNV